MGNNLEPIGSDERIRIVQSNLITTARYEFSVIEKRILYCIINQINIGSKNNPEDYKDDSGWRNITLCINGSDLAKCGEKTAEIRSAMQKLQKRTIEIQKDQRWSSFVFITSIDHYETTNVYKIEISRHIVPYFVELSSKFTAYYIAVALSLKSVYSQRFYELCCQYKAKKTFMIGVDELRKMFAIEGKYQKINDMKKRVIDIPMKEIKDSFDQKLSDLYFKVHPQKNGRQIVAYEFKIHTDSTSQLDELNNPESYYKFVKEQLIKYSGRDHRYINSVLNSIRGNDEMTAQVAKRIDEIINRYKKTGSEAGTIGAVIRISLVSDFKIAK